MCIWTQLAYLHLLGLWWIIYMIQHGWHQMASIGIIIPLSAIKDFGLASHWHILTQSTWPDHFTCNFWHRKWLLPFQYHGDNDTVRFPPISAQVTKLQRQQWSHGDSNKVQDTQLRIKSWKHCEIQWHLKAVPVMGTNSSNSLRWRSPSYENKSESHE